MPTAKDCAKRKGKGMTYSPIGGSIQTSILLHEMVHLYLNEAGLQPEAYDINQVMTLPAIQKRINPSNYAFFVGSKFFPLG